jgi:internalin A
MTRNEAYEHAVRKIDEAWRSGKEELDLSFRQDTENSQRLTELPESVSKLTHLQTLDLSSNQLTELPESLGHLAQLRTLSLSVNGLTVLPESLGRLTQLQELHLSRNQLAELPESLGRLTQLETLDLSWNQLTGLPESLGQLAKLRFLDLSYNRLTTIPPTIGKLQQIVMLHLPGNCLTRLPRELSKLSQLRAFTLQGNQIERIPRSIGWLKQLRRLCVGHRETGRGNPLIDLPMELRDLTNLEQLDVSNCPNLNLPQEIVAKIDSPREILEYYFSIRGDRGSALRELKLIVVGRGGAGKTSIVKRLNRQPLDPAESETHGINISPLTVMCDDGPVTARVWDFGGQHVLHAMHEFFLTARSLYLLVLGEREDMAERDAAYWLQLIRSYAGPAPVVVALNRSEGRPREMDRESLERNYGPILAWVPTECSGGFGHTIENLRAALVKAADGMNEVRDRFPSKWWNIKEWLEDMDEPYLDFARYQERCRELGEQDPQQQEKLASWLNDLGIAINYANDERLHDTTVLRPEWLANGIYAILRANDPHHDQPYAPDAILTSARLGPIYAGAEKLNMLKAADYPEKKWSFLLQLMRLFQLAFPIDDLGQKLLVPTLLPVEPPPDCEEPDTEDRTRLRYEFGVVPGPLLPKLLVRTFSLIENERRWRRGAMHSFGQARARVWTTQDERWVHITAVGTEDDRKELVTMVGITLRKLIAEYRNLHAVEQWEYEGDWVPRRTLERMGVLAPVDDSTDGEEV